MSAKPLGADRITALREVEGRRKISVIITTFNEEINVADCIHSVLWADEILLVDSFSTDQTVAIAENFRSRSCSVSTSARRRRRTGRSTESPTTGF
ncbi:MAG: glycosyltransferase [Thermoanaerobaculia bacterium]